MFPQAGRFERWLRRRSPHATTSVHYLNDLKLFFAWAGKPPTAIILHDVDAYIEYCRRLGHAMAYVSARDVVVLFGGDADNHQIIDYLVDT